MPIYEYRCNQCHKKFSELVMNPQKNSEVVCKGCGSSDLNRLISGFAYHRSESDRLADYDSGKQQGSEFYKDSRNIGLQAKKRAQEMGVDLGSQFEEVVDRARSAKNIDDLEKISGV